MRYYCKLIVIIFLIIFLGNVICYATQVQVSFSCNKALVYDAEKLKLKIIVPKSTGITDAIKVCAFSVDYNSSFFFAPTITNTISEKAVVNTARIYNGKTQVYYTFADTMPINLNSDTLLLELEFEAKPLSGKDISNFVFTMINFKYGSGITDNISFVNPSPIYVKIYNHTLYPIDLSDFNLSNNFITKINPNTTVDNMVTALNPSVGTSLQFLNAFNKLIYQNENVGTGTKINVTSLGKTTAYTVVIYGDVSGDGKIEIDDLSIIKNHLLKSSRINDLPMQKAADIFETGSITISDLIAVKKHLLNIQLIHNAN